MGEKDRTGEEQVKRPKVKVTDRRRVREGGAAPAPAGAAPSDPATAEPHARVPRETVEEKLAAARREVADYRDHLVRLQAEFANYRKRVLKEATRAVELASEPLMRQLLEVLDEFELALMAAEQKPDFDKFLHGVELVYAKLVDTLKAEGLEHIDAGGEPFDPTLHEALMGSGPGGGEPVVADVLRQGYTLKGRVIRPAGVRVTNER